MRIAESVTFGGSGLDRAAELRRQPDRIAELLQTGQVLPLWRGKPLTEGDAALAWVPAGSPALAHGGALVFLGLDGATPRFAQDISDWSPEAGAAAAEAGLFDVAVQHHPALPDSHAFVDLRGVMAALSKRDAELAATAKALLHWHRSHGFCAACGTPTVIAMAGWQRDCPACGAQHYPRTDPVVIMLVTRGNRLLLGRSPGWPEGMYSCLAGFLEPGETVEAAVRREVAEETGVEVGVVRYLASQPWPFPASLMIGCLAQATSDAITLDPLELADSQWLSREDLVGVLAGTHPHLKPARKGSIARFLMENWLADRLI
ncbi:MAG: NAD(+) diphosphatase [Pseudorhodobacter sp.]|nr:NAD(+) diphosphatase [Pseudorhodobacter sp.]